MKKATLEERAGARRPLEEHIDEKLQPDGCWGRKQIEDDYLYWETTVLFFFPEANICYCLRWTCPQKGECKRNFAGITVLPVINSEVFFTAVRRFMLQPDCGQRDLPVRINQSSPRAGGSCSGAMVMNSH